MRNLTFPRRAVASLIPLLLIAGCGGGGHHDSSQTGAEKVAALFANGTFEGAPGAESSVQGRGPSTALQSRIRFFGSGVSIKGGVVAFYSGAPGTTDFRVYSADIKNVVLTPANTVGVSGGIAFDMTNFTAGAPYKGTLHYAGVFGYSGGDTLSASGFLTGKNLDDADVKIAFGLNYATTAKNVDLSGDWKGTIGLGTLSANWTGTFAHTAANGAKLDAVHLHANVNYTAGTQTGALIFDGVNTRFDFTGPFDGAQIGVPGATGEWVVSSSDGKTLDGAYVVIDTSDPLNPTGLVAGLIHATRPTSTGGSGGSVSVPTGYYDGGVKRDGQLTGDIIKLNIVHSSSTTGANGSMVIKRSSASTPYIGGRIAKITGSASGFTITVDQITSIYSGFTLTGSIQGGEATITGYDATLEGSTTHETGTFDALGKVSLNTPTFSKTFAGQLAPTSGGNPSNFTGKIVASADGTVTVTSSSLVLGNVPLPPITGYIAGSSIALADASEGALPSPYTGDTLYGDFDGELPVTTTGTQQTVGTGAILGKYVLFINSSSGANLFAQYGNLSLTGS